MAGTTATTSSSIVPTCDEPLVNGCLADGNHWVLVEHDDGKRYVLRADLARDP